MRIRILKNIKKNLYWRLNKYLLEKNKYVNNYRYCILNKEETINKIIQGYSISRYGDGEFSLVYKSKGINFQDFDIEISKRLNEILKSNLKKHLVAIPSPLIKVDDLMRGEGYYWSKFYFQSKKYLDRVLDPNKIYYDSMITRFYMPYTQKDKNINIIEKLIKYFEKKDILIIEGENTRFGLGNSLLKGTNSISRFLLPSKNSFSKYNEVLEEVLMNIPKETLILIALGPTATVLAYDLCLNGYQAIDIGHMDIEYEWYLHRAKTKIDILYKSVNEVSGIITKDIDNIKLKNKYMEQIKKRIL